MVYFPLVDHIFLEAQCLARFMQHVNSLTMAALSCYSLLHTLPYKLFDNKHSLNAKGKISKLVVSFKLAITGPQILRFVNKYSHPRYSVCYIFSLNPLLNDK